MISSSQLIWKGGCRKMVDPSSIDLLKFFMDQPEYSSLGGETTADIRIVVTGGPAIPAHSFLLESVSPFLKRYVEKFRRERDLLPEIPIAGVPYGAVIAFLLFIYNHNRSRSEDQEIFDQKYAIHLLVLSHCFDVPLLKKQSTKQLIDSLTPTNAIDVLNLAELCDSSYLQLKCLKFISMEFDTVARSEGWWFIRKNDPHLELEILLFIEEEESREKRRVRKRGLERAYGELMDAMNALVHICTEGCGSISPYEKAEPNRTVQSEPSCRFSKCKPVEERIRHFAKCPKRVRGGCGHCKHMWQLLRLHSCVCDVHEPNTCKVPLCRHFKLRMGVQGSKKEDETLQLLAREIALAKAISNVLINNNKLKKRDSINT